MLGGEDAASRVETSGLVLCQGDAEDLPFATDSFDRYVSAGSIGAALLSAVQCQLLTLRDTSLLSHDDTQHTDILIFMRGLLFSSFH